jgi:hypothetical protein
LGEGGTVPFQDVDILDVVSIVREEKRGFSKKHNGYVVITGAEAKCDPQGLNRARGSFRILGYHESHFFGHVIVTANRVLCER